ncbi:MAG TPA: Mur ligase family protein [Acidimicrobiales bacterium]|nr:Mur ligase family protein [Acidimicrobiales bacterium]
MPWTLGEALAWLEDHVNLEAAVAGRMEPDLSRMRRLCALMGDPERAYPVVHVTGTNGKGSTTRMVTALLAASGLAVGMYTSPDLEGVNERLAVAHGHIDALVEDGEADAADEDKETEPRVLGPVPIPGDDLATVLEAVAALEPLVDGRPTRFEVLTAAAFRWFADSAVDAAVVEVGLGGLYDATNVVDAQVAVVTNVSFDHEDVLGPTLEGIAAEKAGIVKPGSTLVLGVTDDTLAPVFLGAGAERAWQLGRHFGATADRVAVGGRLVSLRTPAAEYDDVYLPVHGAHQVANAAVAVAAAEAFFGGPLAPDVVAEAFAGLRLPGRMEVMGRRPLVLLDGAHNVAGARAAAATVAEEFPGDQGVVAVVGMLRGRDPAHMLSALGLDHARLVVACPAPSPRTVPAAEVAAAARALGVEAQEVSGVGEAVELALAAAGEDDRVLITGSLYVVGAARSVLRRRAAG